MTNPRGTTLRHLISGCAMTLLVSAGSAAAFAHGGSQNHNGNGSGGAGSASNGIASAHGHHHDAGASSNGPSGLAPLRTRESGGLEKGHGRVIVPPARGPGNLGQVHKPIVLSPSSNPPAKGFPPGAVVRDHRHGKACSYIVGDPGSECRYQICEGHPGGHPHCPPR